MVPCDGVVVVVVADVTEVMVAELVGNYQVIVQVAPETTPHSPAYLTPPVALRVT